MQVAFHMGAHKTASSLIQHRLRRIGGRFAGRQLVFMDNDTVLSTSWGDWCRRERGGLDAARASFAKQIESWRKDNADHVILSSEGFLGGITVFERGKLYPGATEVLQRLRHLISETGNEVTCHPVYYIRQTDRFLESCLSQRLSLGRELDPETVFDKPEFAELTWKTVIEAIEAAMGARIVVRRFEDLKEKGPADFVAEFLSACGLPDASTLQRHVALGRAVELLPEPVRKLQPVADFLRPNAGLSIRGAEMALQLRPLVTKDEWRKTVRPFLRRHFSALRDPGGGYRAPDALAKVLRETYRDDCAWMGDRLTLRAGNAT